MWYLMSALFLVCKWYLLDVYSHGGESREQKREREREVGVGRQRDKEGQGYFLSLTRDLITSQRPPPFNAITSGVRILAYEF